MGSLPSGLLERLEHEVEILGFECVEATFAVESSRRILRIMLDAPDGVKLDQCARVSRALGPFLDSCDDLPSGYVLEVSSPGINRPLTKPEHFRRFCGERVKIRLRVAQDGGLTLTGVLGTLEGETLQVETPHGVRVIELAQIARARLHRDMDQILKSGRHGAAR
ncbi:MAG TPA: ribosome maturation factor RimP [Candidatus Krumholzibacteria bacterium]|nr:ribosome maturation factor RimP [Candidatus Krumholzibacteria bacterium]